MALDLLRRRPSTSFERLADTNRRVYGRYEFGMKELLGKGVSITGFQVHRSHVHSLSWL